MRLYPVGLKPGLPSCADPCSAPPTPHPHRLLIQVPILRSCPHPRCLTGTAPSHAHNKGGSSPSNSEGNMSLENFPGPLLVALGERAR